jgi:(p)ppGpp synthase/HD superfamily hydrolase
MRAAMINPERIQVRISQPPAKVENRESFFARLRPILAPSDLMDIEVAYALVKHGHRWQTRTELDETGTPLSYFKGHLRPTALIAIDELGISDKTIILGCLLHDSLEDTNDINDRMIEHLFGSEVAVLVKLLTKDPKEGYFDRLVKHGTWKTWLVKGCDRLSNLRTMKDCTPEFRARQFSETREKIYPLMDLLFARCPEDYRFSVGQLRTMILETSKGWLPWANIEP